MRQLKTPITDDDLAGINVGDQISISGTIYTGRDAALPQLVELIEKNEVPFDLNGAAIMHTAFSYAGIAPTTSSKIEIESTIPKLSEAGVKIHIGKGKLSDETLNELSRSIGYSVDYIMHKSTNVVHAENISIMLKDEADKIKLPVAYNYCVKLPVKSVSEKELALI